LSQRFVLAGVVVVVLLELGVIGYMMVRPTPTPTPTTTPVETTPTATKTTPSMPKVIRIGTDPVGSISYKMGAYLSDIFNRHLGRDLGINFYSMPFPAGGNLKALVIGDIEFAEPTDLELLDLYTYGGTFGIIKISPDEVKKLPVQTFWDFSLTSFLLVKKEDAGKYRCWRDLAGKPVFLTPIGFGTHLSMLRALRALGINVTHVEISLTAVGDAFERGSIVATAAYVTGVKAAPPWLLELDAKMDLAPVNLCPDEVEKLEKAGIIVVKKNAAEFFKRNAGMGEIVGTQYFHGFHAAVDVPEDLVYLMLKILENTSKDYERVAAEFAEMAMDFVGLQLKGLKSALSMGIPVHPGLAKFLKEKGVWDPQWDKYIARSLKPQSITG
jgi:TRAP-type uncharacterized transport system substrate-binding protein